MLRNRLGYPVDKDRKYYQRRLVRITPTDKLVTTGETTCVGDLTDFTKVVPWRLPGDRSSRGHLPPSR